MNGFAPAFDAEADPEFPGDGRWSCPVFAFDYDGRVVQEFKSPWGTPFVVRVTPADGSEWVGLFPAGGLGGEDDAPGSAAVVAQDQVRQVVPVIDSSLLLLVSYVDMVAIDSQGIAWTSPRLALDGLRITHTDADGIHCVADTLAGSAETIVVNPATGEPASGYTGLYSEA
jgi:hypothetical protein